MTMSRGNLCIFSFQLETKDCVYYPFIFWFCRRLTFHLFQPFNGYIKNFASVFSKFLNSVPDTSQFF